MQGGGAANHGLNNTCAATSRLPCVPRAGLGKPWSASNTTNLLHHGSQNRIQKLVETWRPERDLDCTSHAEQEQHEPMHGLKLVVKEEALPLREQPEFLAPAELAKRGLLAPDTWNCKPALINLKVSIDGLLEQSHILVAWHCILTELSDKAAPIGT